METNKISLALGVFLISAAALLTEVSLIRVFDVLFFPNISYMIITCSLFAYGIAGVYSAIKPLRAERNIHEVSSQWALWLSLSILAILPLMNLLPFNLSFLSEQPVRQLLYFGAMYLSLALPFFWTGRIFTALFSRYAKSIRSLYFADLAGAALGSLLIIPFIKAIGPGGLLFIAGALGLLASLLFSGRRSRAAVFSLASLLLIVLPFMRSPQYFDFIEHQYKRGVKYAREQGLVEVTVWDPISKIDVINFKTIRHIAYDGGSQSSAFHNFDGDMQRLKENLPTEIGNQFWQRGVLVSHALREGTSPDVLVIGSAGGQEIKAALMYGANHVDAVEMVGAVVELGQTTYSDYIGDLFHHPSVSLHVDEGRNYIRSSQKTYDIIQLFSNHTSSSIAAGTGAATTNYLQTTDAYREYFSHLNENGILHINHHFYPRMITTAARAWFEMGWDNFDKHVIVYEYDADESLPTLLIKKEPWTEDELKTIDAFFQADFPGEEAKYTLVVDPFHPEKNSVPGSYFTGQLSRADIERAGVRIEPATDDRPYFNLSVRSLNPFPNGLADFVRRPFEGVALGLLTIFMTGMASLFYGLLFILIPLNYSAVGKLKWRNKSLSLIYFSCLGFGFIVIEFVLIQMFIHIIGSPLYTVSTVLFAMLSSAGIGSYTSGKLKITLFSRWSVPFLGIVLTVLLLLTIVPQAKVFLLGTGLMTRILCVTLLSFPVGFFLGMPFPLGISALESQPDGAIAWAWGMNGLFTIVGGLMAVIFSMQWGFTVTLLIACAIYMLAFIIFARIRTGLLLSV